MTYDFLPLSVAWLLHAAAKGISNGNGRRSPAAPEIGATQLAPGTTLYFVNAMPSSPS